VKELSSDTRLIRLIFTLIGVFLLFFTIPENTFSEPVDTLNLQLQWVYPLKVTDLKLVDFNGDGINEILVGYDSDSARVGILDAVNQTILFQSDGLLGPVIAVEAGDLNGDSATDIFCGGKLNTYVGPGYLTILYGSGFDSTYNLLNLDYSVTAVALYSPGADTGCILLVGTWYDYRWKCEPFHNYDGFLDLGNLFQFACLSLACACTTNLGEMDAIRVFDINGDGIDDVICGHDFNYYCPTGTSYTLDGWCKITVCFPETIETVVTLEDPGYGVIFDKMEIGDIDGDASPEVVISYRRYWSLALPPLPNLFSFNTNTWEAEWSIEHDSSQITGLVTCHLLNGPSASLCVAYQNGIIRIKDGATGTDLAISRQLPLINHFVLGNVDQDSLTEICIASDDSLYVYETPSITTDVEEIEDYSHPEGFCLFQNYPNPFNPETIIRFTIPFASEVTLSIYNILGEQVRTFHRHYKAGTHTLMWDGKNSSGEEIASGVYLYKLSAGSYQETKKMVLIR
jgi:hypothetical protein